jgi:hypothetical protein
MELFSQLSIRLGLLVFAHFEDKLFLWLYLLALSFGLFRRFWLRVTMIKDLLRILDKDQKGTQR